MTGINIINGKPASGQHYGGISKEVWRYNYLVTEMSDKPARSNSWSAWTASGNGAAFELHARRREESGAKNLEVCRNMLREAMSNGCAGTAQM